MRILDDFELENVLGGDSTIISSSIINSIINVIKLLEDGGYKVGSAVRRISEGNLCPLE